MSQDSLTGKFNATNVTFDKEQTPDVENNINPMENIYAVDVPVMPTPSQIAENPNLKQYIVPNVVVEDVPVYEPKEDKDRRPLTGNERQQQKSEELDLNQAKKEDGAYNVGRIVTGQDQNEVVSQAQKDKKDREFNNLLQRLKDHRLWIMGIMNDIQDEIDQLTQDIEDCGRVIEALQDFKDGKIALGDDGYPANEHARKAIKEWEKKNNKKWDPSTQEGMDALDTIILSKTKDRNEFIKQRSDKQTEWNQWNDEWNATDEKIAQFSDSNYANIVDTSDTENFAERMDKLRELEELKQTQDTLDNNEGATTGVDTENSSLTTATDIFNSAPGIS